MREIIIASILLLLATACEVREPIETGRWSGTLTPMNHPEMETPVSYEVYYENGELEIDLIGPDSTVTTVYDLTLKSDTLYFSFNEPEEQVKLDCALGRGENEGFAGKCVDPSGKWARFAMKPPE